MEPAIETTIYHCPGCGTRVTVGKSRRFQNPACPKCGLMLREGEPPKPSKRVPILILSGLGVLLIVAVYLIVR